LAQKPVLAVLHKDSTAVTVIRESLAGLVLDFDGKEVTSKITKEFYVIARQFIEFAVAFKIQNINISEFEKFSAHNMTSELVKYFEEIIDK
jgi:hypothetical protein